jgi:hypothetical protein
MSLRGAGDAAGPSSSAKVVDSGKVPGYSGRVTYIARISTFGRDFGVAVEVNADLPLDGLAKDSKALDAFLLAKHRELELAYMEQAGR